MKYLEAISETCQILREISRQVQIWVKEQPNVGEESLTDWILFQASQRSKRLYYEKFSRQKEAKETGADWEWWVLSDTYIWASRIQAKRLKSPQANYNSLTYTTKNQTVMQIEKLISDADRHEQVALYAFYVPSLKKQSLCNNGVDIAQEGVFLADAMEIFNSYAPLKEKKLIFREKLVSKSKPLSCFFCCSFVQEQRGFERYIQHYFSGRGLQKSIPQYVFSTIEKKFSESRKLKLA